MPRSPIWTDGRPMIPVDALGQSFHLTEWLVIGPFRVDSTAKYEREQNTGRLDGLDTDYLGGETQARPAEGDLAANLVVPSGSSSWERLTGAEKYTLTDVYPGASNSVAYAATYFDVNVETSVILRPSAVEKHFTAVGHVMVDGVTVAPLDDHACITLAPGSHCLMLKIVGFGTSPAWEIDVTAGLPADLGGGLSVGLVRPSGFWQGTEETPGVEISAVLANSGTIDIPLGAVSAGLNGNDRGGAPEATVLAVGEVREVRIGVPLGDVKPESVTTADVSNGSKSVSVDITVPVKPDFGVLHVMEGFHCDPVWVSDQHHYNLVCLDNVRQLLDGCAADPTYRAFVHEIDYLKSFVDEYPDYRALLFGLIQRGQVNLGSSYNEPNENNCSGEALVRNILYGNGFHRKFLGGNPGFYHAWDVFGHVPQLSQIIKKSGLRGAVWSKQIRGFPPMFDHMSLDGTKAVHVRTSYGWDTTSNDQMRNSTVQLLAEKQTWGVNRHLVVDCSDFTSPAGWMIGHTKEMAHSYPQVVMSGPEAFLDGVLNEDGSVLPVTTRNPSQYHIGTQMSRSELKIANRKGENLLYAAETWSTFAALMGANYPDLSIDKAWRQLLFGEHHDALTGTPCDMSYLDLMVGYREALDLASDVVKQATEFIADAVKKPAKGTPVVVFNPLNWARTSAVTVDLPEGMDAVEVKDSDGNAVACEVSDGTVRFLATVPSVGYASFALVEAKTVATAKTTENFVMENEFWTITLDPAKGGGISSLIDRKTGRELVDASIGVANDLVSLREKHDRNEPSWELWTSGDRHHASYWPARVVIEESPVGTTATITGEMNTVCRYERTLTLRPGSRVIEADVKILGYENEDDLFVVTFPAALGGSLPTFEDRFGSITARRGAHQFDYRTWRWWRFSDCAVYPVYNWVDAGWSARVDVGGGESSLNLGFMGLILPHDDRVTDDVEPLLKSFAHAGVACTSMFDDDDQVRWQGLLEQFGEPISDVSKISIEDVSEQVYDTTIESRNIDLGDENQWMAVTVDGNNAYASSLLAKLPDTASKALAAQESERGWGMVIAEDTDTPDGHSAIPVLILSAVSNEKLTEAFAWIGEQLESGFRVALPDGCDFRANPTQVDDYGVALLSDGTGAASQEPDGTLTLFLTHTSGWSEHHLNRKFVPEWRDMSFRYGILPHEGTWRDAGLVRAGYERNMPAVAAMPSGDGGSLAATDSFLDLDDPNTVITAIKPAGNPVVDFESGASDPASGLIVRGYNSDGRGSSGALKLAASIQQATVTDLMENETGVANLVDGAVDWRFDPYGIETLRVTPGEIANAGSGDIGATGEGHVIWCRYWQHNVGAHPMGYMPVGIFIDGHLPIENAGGSFPTVYRVRVTINNNLTDASISGTARLEAPGNWTLTPGEIAYDLGPREHMVKEIVVSYERQPHVGLIKARMEYGGQLYQDVLEAGREQETIIHGGGGGRLNQMTINKEREPSWELFREDGDILVKVSNPWWQPLDVELAMVTPVETWPEAGDHALADISPRHSALTIPGKGTEIIRFSVTGKPHTWAWAKMMCNGKPYYLPVPGTTA
jgi:alpha-mannosidase